MTLYPRQIKFEGIFNFRDLGGYRIGDGRMVALRRLFRSGEMHHFKERIRFYSIDLNKLSLPELLIFCMYYTYNIRVRKVFDAKEIDGHRRCRSV